MNVTLLRGSAAGTPHAVPVVVDEHAADLAGHDYADAFELVLAQPDSRTAEEWVRAGLEGAPRAIRRLVVLVHRHVLRFELGPEGSEQHILGWRIVRNEPDLLRIEAESGLGKGVILAQRTRPAAVRLTTFLLYRRPTAARRVWAVVGPLHRTIAPLLLAWAARHPVQPIGRGRTSG